MSGILRGEIWGLSFAATHSEARNSLRSPLYSLKKWCFELLKFVLCFRRIGALTEKGISSNELLLFWNNARL